MPAVCIVLLTALILVRNIKMFAGTHMFADAMIFITIVIIAASGFERVQGDGSQLAHVPLYSMAGMSESIGIAIYSFEGFGVLLPVQDITANKQAYPK